MSPSRPSPRLAPPSADLIARLAAIVGPAHALTDPDQQLPYLTEWRDQYTGTSPLVLRPGSVAEVVDIVRLCNEARVGVVPQAGNTGLVGGQTPFATNSEVVVNVARLRRVREADAAGSTLTVEAGLTLAEVQAEADRIGRFFPLALPSQGSCRIGGNLATNAGGVGVLAYGNTRQLTLGIEVVLADGQVWDGLRAVKKDNAGYDLRDLVIGSEGTLGIITAAVLRLFPRPAETATAFLALPTMDAGLALLSRVQGALGAGLTAFEFMPRIMLDFVVKNIAGARDPFSGRHAWYALIEACGAKADGSARDGLETALAAAVEDGLVSDVVMAETLAQARDYWRLREAVSEAQKPEGGNIKHDVSVPVARIPDFVRAADAQVERIAPGARTIPVGHFGDGNIHYNIAQPLGMDARAFLALGDAISDAVHDIALGMGGSIAAEHGVGRQKRAALARTKAPVELALMRGIKAVFDPNGILNPGKVL